MTSKVLFAYYRNLRGETKKIGFPAENKNAGHNKIVTAKNTDANNDVEITNAGNMVVGHRTTMNVLKRTVLGLYNWMGSAPQVYTGKYYVGSKKR